jgi:elongation factor G
VNHVEVLCPEDLTGAVMGEIQSRRGIVEGMDTESHFQKISSKVPQAEMHGFSSALRSISQGRAKFKMNFDSYWPLSGDLQRKLTEEYNKSAEEVLV